MDKWLNSMVYDTQITIVFMGFINLWGAHIMCYEKEYIGEMITMEFIWSVYISIYIYRNMV